MKQKPIIEDATHPAAVMRRLLCILAVIALVAAACQSTPAPAPAPTETPAGPTAEPTEEPTPTVTPIPPGTILKIYSSLPLTGARASEAQSVVNAIHLAITTQTEGGTLCNGLFKITYESLNDVASGPDYDTLREETNARKAGQDADAMAYIGPLDSGAARVSMPVLDKAGLAMLSPGADYIGLTKPYGPSEPDSYFYMGVRNFMRLVAPQDVQGADAASWAKALGAKSVFIIDDAEQFGHGPSDAFQRAAQQADLQVIGRNQVDLKSGNLLVLAGQAMRADAVFYGGLDPLTAGQVLAQMRKAGATTRFIGTSAIMSTGFITTAGSAAEGAYAVADGVALDKLPPKGQKFVQDYQSRYNSAPDSAAVYGYEAASVVLAAMGKVCLKDRTTLLSAMFHTHNFDGVLGKWSFDANGDITLPTLLHYRLQNGAWRVQ